MKSMYLSARVCVFDLLSTLVADKTHVIVIFTRHYDAVASPANAVLDALTDPTAVGQHYPHQTPQLRGVLQVLEESRHWSKPFGGSM